MRAKRKECGERYKSSRGVQNLNGNDFIRSEISSRLYALQRSGEMREGGGKRMEETNLFKCQDRRGQPKSSRALINEYEEISE